MSIIVRNSDTSRGRLVRRLSTTLFAPLAGGNVPLCRTRLKEALGPGTSGAFCLSFLAGRRTSGGVGAGHSASMLPILGDFISQHVVDRGSGLVVMLDRLDINNLRKKKRAVSFSKPSTKENSPPVSVSVGTRQPDQNLVTTLSGAARVVAARTPLASRAAAAVAAAAAAAAALTAGDAATAPSLGGMVLRQQYLYGPRRRVEASGTLMGFFASPSKRIRNCPSIPKRSCERYVKPVGDRGEASGRLG